jgi:hypothetical protein
VRIEDVQVAREALAGLRLNLVPSSSFAFLRVWHPAQRYWVAMARAMSAIYGPDPGG